jgi:hypothetical protein
LPDERSERTDFECCLAGLQAALGEEAFAAAWAEGQSMTLEDAIADALERSGTVTGEDQ